MEAGSEWPGHFGGCDEVVAIGHDADGLLERTQQEIAKVRGRGHQVRVAVLACNETVDAAARARRGEVVAELLAALTPARFGRLLLSTSERASLSFRCEMLALAATLTRTLRHRSASVSVRFGNGAQAQALATAPGGVSATSRSAIRTWRRTALVKGRARPHG
jgi:hypothetical protein